MILFIWDTEREQKLGEEQERIERDKQTPPTPGYRAWERAQFLDPEIMTWA